MMLRDRRSVLCRRPDVITGSELTRDGLDLVYDHISKFFVVLMQGKANGGMLLIDDFGRSRSDRGNCSPAGSCLSRSASMA